MASEDSDQLGSVLSPVHRLRDLSDLHQPIAGEVATVVDHPDDLGELLEVRRLRRSQRIRLEERDDRLHEIPPLADDEAMHGLTVIVVPSVDDHAAHPEERLQLLQASNAGCPLSHGELVSHLPAGSVAASAPSTSLADEADREASFSVYETKDPTDPDQPFLLVFRTARIVTADASHGSWNATTSTGRILGFSSI
jgi:hypothetical protein